MSEPLLKKHTYGPVMVDLEGHTLSPQEIVILKHPMVGAVILFTRNFKSPEQLKTLIQAIHNTRTHLLITVDQEGGSVQRFKGQGFRQWPAARVYGDLYDLDPTTGLALTWQYGKAMGEELAAYGIDLNLAPVLDLHNDNDVIGNLDRSFHANPKVVATLSTVFIKGLAEAGISATAKHFPGHSACHDDSHISKPVSDITLDELEKTHLQPFTQLIQQHLLKSIMPAHIIYRNIDPNHPAGFSKIWLQDILREKYQFTGTIISDCLSMKGAEIGSMGDRAKQALTAGCDMVILCNQTRALTLEVLDDLARNFTQSEISKQRISSLAS